MMENTELKQAIETLLFITDQPIGVSRMCQAVGVKDRDRVTALIGELRQEYETRGGGIQVIEIAEGFQMATRPGFAAFIRNLYKDKMTMRLSTAALETLSIIAYKQPLTRAEIEQIRGVEVIAALETLLEKALVRVVGRKETVGRPLLYGTTPDFLRHFGLRSIRDLPPIEEFQPPAEPGAEPFSSPGEDPSPAPSEPERDSSEPAPDDEAGPEPPASSGDGEPVSAPPDEEDIPR